MNKEQIKQLIQCGVNRDIENRQIIFQVCSGCGDDYTQQNKPDLLQCGHLICRECLLSGFYKSCTICRGKLEVRVKGFSNLIKSKTNLQLFDFVVRSQYRYKSEIIRDVQLEMTLQQVCGKSQNLKQDLSNDHLIALNKTSYRYSTSFKTKLKQLGHLRLHDKSTNKLNHLYMYNPIKGGGYSSFEFNNLQHQEWKKFNQTAPDFRIVKKGLNLEGVCQIKNCLAQGKKAWSNKGIGFFNMNKEVGKAPCPLCKQKMKQVNNMGFYKCKAQVQGEMKQEQVQIKKSYLADKNQLLTFKQVDGSKIDWIYLQVQS